MQESLLQILRCPVTGSRLNIQVIERGGKKFNGIEKEIIREAILWSDNGLFFPVIKGVPRLIPEAVIDYEYFLRRHIPDFNERKHQFSKEHVNLISLCAKKNKRTKASFALEWKLFDYEKDKTWDADQAGILNRFLTETDETAESIQGKFVFDAGCGNGLLDSQLAGKGCTVIAMDLSMSIEKASEMNTEENALFIQGDVQFPPLARFCFDMVHCSGVLIHTNNTESSFAIMDTLVISGGKLSVWLYHPRKDFIHHLFNRIRNISSRLPMKIQYNLYLFTLFPVSYIIKKIKGNKQNAREMMVNILDWFSPEYRWEHEPDEARSWFEKRSYKKIRLTTYDLFGFNMIGEKSPEGKDH
jgi:SAM-dependent methyltransferase/uncharacterized protein YbaR (Trm112 family)